jgi:colicin import membrane protein
MAKEKARLQKEKQAQLDKLEQEKLKLDKSKKDKEARAQEAKAAALAAKQKALLLAQEEAQRAEQDHKKSIARMMALANGNGDDRSSGTAAKSAGPSAGYAGRIKALLKRNTTYVETPTGNPTVEIEVRTSPDGTILSRKIIKTSGVKSWDEAVLNAIDKTEVFPRDIDGRVHSPYTIVHRPND